MAKLKVMCARSMHVAVGALGKAFAEAAATRSSSTSAPSGAPGQARRRRDRRRGGSRVPGSTSSRRPARWCPARGRTRQDLYRGLHPRRGDEAGFFHRRGVQAPAGECPRLATSDPAVGGSAAAAPSRVRSNGPRRHDEAEEPVGEEWRRSRPACGRGQGRVRADAVGRSCLRPRRGDRRAVAATVRPGHDLLRGGDGGERGQGCGHGIDRGVDAA